MSAKFRKQCNINCIMLKNQRLEGKHCSVDPDETAHNSSGSTVFVNSAFDVFGTLRVNVIL